MRETLMGGFVCRPSTNLLTYYQKTMEAQTKSGQRTINRDYTRQWPLLVPSNFHVPLSRPGGAPQRIQRIDSESKCALFSALIQTKKRASLSTSSAAFATLGILFRNEPDVLISPVSGKSRSFPNSARPMRQVMRHKRSPPKLLSILPTAENRSLLEHR